MQSEARRPTSYTLDCTQNNRCRLSLYCGTELNSKSNSLNSIPSHSLVSDGGSLQFPSDLGLDDGSSLRSVNTDKNLLENVPKLLVESAVSRTLDSVTNIPLLRPQNISSDSASEEARHECEDTILNQEAIAVSQDEFKQMAEELEKTKRYLHNLLKDGSFTSMYIDPLSSLGFSALPPIPTTADFSCQTDWPSSGQHATTQFDEPPAEPKTCQCLAQIDELSSTNKQLQRMIEDNKSRFTQELYDQKHKNENLKRLLLAVDAAWRSKAEYATPEYLPWDYEICINNLQRQFRPTVRVLPTPPSSPGQKTGHRSATSTLNIRKQSRNT